MAEEFGYPEYVLELLNEVRELRREVAQLRKEVAELKRAPQPQQQAAIDTEAIAAAIREGVEKLNAAVSSLMESATYLRAVAEEGKWRQAEACLAVFEKLLALQQQK